MALTEAEYRLLARLADIQKRAALRREADRPARPDPAALAALAALRRGLGKPPGTAPEMWPVLLPHLPENIPRPVLDRCLLVGALFGSHPAPWDGGDKPWHRNLGASFRRLDAEERPPGANTEPLPGTERRVIALLRSDDDELPERLRHAVARLKSGGVPVHWGQLLDDLGRWTHPDRPVQRAWGRSFWGGRALATGPTEEADATDDEASS